MLQQQLRAVTPSDRSLLELHHLNEQEQQAILSEFENCRARMLYRSQLAWRFWTQLPWAILGMAEWLLPDRPGAAERSRKRASLILQSYDLKALSSEGSKRLGFVSHLFLMPGQPFRGMIEQFAADPQANMHSRLQAELLKYGCGLTAMARLESKHHLVNMAVSAGSASLPSLTCADMRRRQNRDIQQPAFWQAFPRLMGCFDQLVPEEWSSRRELVQLVYGFHLGLLHQDIDAQQAKFDRFRKRLVLEAGVRKRDAEDLLMAEHLAATLQENCYYALPMAGPDTDPQFVVFQVNSLTPNLRKTVEKICYLSEDAPTPAGLSQTLPCVQAIELSLPIAWALVVNVCFTDLILKLRSGTTTSRCQCWASLRAGNYNCWTPTRSSLGSIQSTGNADAGWLGG